MSTINHHPHGPFDIEEAGKRLPLSMLCGRSDVPTNRPPRLLSCQAFSPTLESSFSGITYYLALAGLATKKLEGCFSLYSGEKPMRGLQARGAIWKLMRSMQRQKGGGFKFTGAYVDFVWSRYMDALAGSTIINNFQLYGRQFFKRSKALDIKVCFYIDGTLLDYFESYGGFEVDSIDASTMKYAIELEREGYSEADAIVTMSKTASISLQERYGVPSNKVSVIVPGANLPDALADASDLPRPGDPTREFLLGFVGLYPLRKGLDRLAAAVGILRGRGLPVRLRVIGNCPEELQKMDGLDFLGRISKTSDTQRFLNAIADVQLGCLISRSELAGIAMLEFLRLGIPVLGTRVGGAVDILEGGGSVIVDPAVTAEELADVIADLHANPSRYNNLKQQAETRSNWASWKRVAGDLDLVIP